MPRGLHRKATSRVRARSPGQRAADEPQPPPVQGTESPNGFDVRPRWLGAGGRLSARSACWPPAWTDVPRQFWRASGGLLPADMPVMLTCHKQPPRSGAPTREARRARPTGPGASSSRAGGNKPTWPTLPRPTSEHPPAPSNLRGQAPPRAKRAGRARRARDLRAAGPAGTSRRGRRSLDRHRSTHLHHRTSAVRRPPARSAPGAPDGPGTSEQPNRRASPWPTIRRPTSEHPPAPSNLRGQAPPRAKRAGRSRRARDLRAAGPAGTSAPGPQSDDRRGSTHLPHRTSAVRRPHARSAPGAPDGSGTFEQPGWLE
jgi:hypothetical protein